MQGSSVTTITQALSRPDENAPGTERSPAPSASNTPSPSPALSAKSPAAGFKHFLPNQLPENQAEHKKLHRQATVYAFISLEQAKKPLTIFLEINFASFTKKFFDKELDKVKKLFRQITTDDLTDTQREILDTKINKLDTITYENQNRDEEIKKVLTSILALIPDSQPKDEPVRRGCCLG